MRNKKGFWPMRMVVYLIAAMVGVIILLLWVRDTAEAAVNEKTAVEACRTTNEAKVFVEEKTSEYATTLRFCNTIDKTAGRLTVPTKKYRNQYNQIEKAAEAEVRDMIKNCWYMWLEGSEANIFRNFPGSKSCHICYRFRIKDNVDDFSLSGVAESMEDPYLAIPTMRF